MDQRRAVTLAGADGIGERQVVFAAWSSGAQLIIGGATAVVEGSTLVLTDRGISYAFMLGGGIAPSYVVTKDGTGTLITADRTR